MLCRTLIGAATFLLSLPVVFPVTNAFAQNADFALTRSDQAALDALAARTAKVIHSSRIKDQDRKVLVMDFFRSSPGTYSRLGSLLADKFSESLAVYAAGFHVVERKNLQEFLAQNWTNLDDLQSNDVCFSIARQLGATGAVLGTLVENNGTLRLTLHLEGFGPPQNEDDIFDLRDRSGIFSLSAETHALLLEPAESYSRRPDQIPDEPGIFRVGVQGVSSPTCSYCPQPEYSDAARGAKLQGTVKLSVLVTVQGEATQIFVVKGAPFGLTQKAINATKNWRFKPAEKDGKPVPVRVEIEITFHLY